MSTTLSTSRNFRRLFSREDPGVLAGFIASAEEACGRRTSVTADDIVVAAAGSEAGMEAAGLSERRRTNRLITIRISGRVGDACPGLAIDMEIDTVGCWLVMRAAITD